MIHNRIMIMVKKNSDFSMYIYVFSSSCLIKIFFSHLWRRLHLVSLLPLFSNDFKIALQKSIYIIKLFAN